MQTDPVGYDGGINLYDYVGDDPVDHTDSTGRAPQDIGDKDGHNCTTGASNGICSSRLTIMSGGAVSTAEDGQILYANQSRGGQQRGDPGRTAKPTGSGNPDKKFKPGSKPGTRIFTDPTTGKTSTRPWPQDGRKGGDGTGVHPGSKYPDGTPVNPGVKTRNIMAGVGIGVGIGAAACAVLEPCGAIVVSGLGLGSLVLVAQ